ncbi:MAG: S-layer homology domain-containing protein [Gemmatimonadaceae bacterium]|nr:S-layer homology domain-containing protein [Gloeobacterales cyanobacterium ES-bin-141]
MFKKLFVVGSVGLAFSLTVAGAIQAADFGDIQGYWAQPYVSTLADRQVIGGFPDGSFRPSAPITRAQFAAIAAKALNLGAGSGGGGGSFNDVPSSYWAARAISAVSGSGLVTGFPDGSFRPEEKITRAQALVILSKSLRENPANTNALGKYEDAQAVPDWARDSVSKAANAGIIVNFPNTGEIEPNRLATRGEVAALMYQTLSDLGQQDLPPLSIGMIGSSNASGVSGRVLAIDNISLSPSSSSLRAGDELIVRVTGTPGAQASFTLQGLDQTIPMREVDPGVYEGSYTVRREDRQPNTRISATLNRANAKPVSRIADRRVSLNTGTVTGTTGRGGDFNGDNRPDILFRNPTTKATLAWFMNGARKTGQASVGPPTASNWQVGGTGDFNGDGRTDILWRDAAAGKNVVWLMNGTDVASTADIPAQSGRSWKIGGAGDFNGDGNPDIVWRNEENGRNQLWLMDGTRRIGNVPIRETSDLKWKIGGTGDLNGDSNTDIVWRNTATGDNVVWLMKGPEFSSSVALSAVSSQDWQIGSVADYNNDGKADIVWRNGKTGTNSLWLMNGAQRVSDVALTSVADTKWSVVGPR